MSRPPAIKRQFSSGGVIFRKSAKGIEVTLAYIKKGKAWCLPKGIIEKDEEPRLTALREVREETGLTGEILEKIGHISYWYFLKEKTVRVCKRVDFYLMRYISGSTDNHDHEVDEARWFSIEEAIVSLQHKGEKEIMKRAKVMIEERL